MNNIRDFICLHYLTKKNNTEFWKDLQRNEIPESLKENLEKWKYRLPIREDFKDTEYLLFFETNWIHILYGLKLLDTQELRKNFNFINKENLDYCNELLNNFKNSFNVETIKHKEFLKYVRNLI